MRRILHVAERRRAPRRAPAALPAARAGLVAVVLAAFGAGLAQAPSAPLTLVADDLANPRGVAVLPSGDLIVAEAGSGDHEGDGRWSGRVLRLHDRDGDGRWLGRNERSTLVEDQLSFNGRTVFGSDRDEVGGLGDVALGPEGLALFTKDDPFGGYIADGARRDIALASVPLAGGRVRNVAAGSSTLNAVAWDPVRGVAFVAESGANRLLEVGMDGTVRTVIDFPPLADDQQAVPSGIAVDPRDGRLWVALFSGVLYDTPTPGERRTFARGAARVVRVDPEAGTATPVITGLTTAVDVAVDGGGTAYVLQMTTAPPTPRLPDGYDLHAADATPRAGGYARFTGRLTAHPPEGPARVLADGLDAPTNLTLAGDVLYVSTGQGTPGRPIPGPHGPTRIRGRVWRLPADWTAETPGQR